MSSNKRTFAFIFIVCFVCALLLSTLASVLKIPQERAREFYRIQQMLLAAQILKYDGTIEGKKASEKEIFSVYNAKIKPMLTNDQGDLLTFEKAGIDFQKYLEEHQKSGFSGLPLKLLYIISQKQQVEGYIIPINGFGLWDAIYGYLALAADADTVLGTTWYQQAETAGLGADIALPSWQKQFRGKVIFQPSSDGAVNFSQAPLGITVVKGKVSEVLAGSAQAQSAVDGISGATLTGKGVTEAYADCLAPYRPFLIKAHEKHP